MEYNGAQNAENGSDISRLVDILKDWEFKFKEKEEESKRGTIPPEPKYQDIIKTIGNVGLAVPMGFVMVHNDLNKIYEYLKDGDGSSTSRASSSSTSWQDVASVAITTAKDSAVALASIGLVYKIIDKYTISDITQGIKDIVNLAVDVLPSAAESISQAINSMGSGVVATILNVDELSSNEEIASQRKVNAQRYLSLYYNSLFNDLGYEAILSEDGTQIIGVKPYSYDDKGSTVKEILTGQATGKEVTDLGIDTWAEFKKTMIAVNATAKTQAWLNLAEEEVPQLVATATSVYDMLTDSSIQSTMSEMTNLFVQAYYLAQIENLGYELDSSTGKLKKSSYTGSTLRDIISGDASAKELEKTAVETYKDIKVAGEEIKTGKVKAWTNLIETTVPELVTSAVGTYKVATDSALQGTIGNMMDYYIQAFYANQLLSLGYEVDFEKDTLVRQVSVEEIFGLAKEAYGIYKSKGWTTIVDAGASALSSAITQISTAWKGTKGAGNEEALKKAYGWYIQAYYANQVASLGYDVDFAKNTLKAGSSFDSIYANIKDLYGIYKSGGWTTAIDALSNSLSSAITKVSTAWKNAGSAENDDALKEAYGWYLKADYANIIASMGYEVDYEKGTLTKKLTWDAVWANVKDVAGTILTGGIGVIAESLADSWASVTTTISDANSTKEATKDFKQQFNEALMNTIIDANTDVDYSSYVTNLTDFITKFGNILVNQIDEEPERFKFTTTGTNPEVGQLKKAFIQNVASISPDILTSAFNRQYAESIQTSVKEAVGNYTIEIQDATKTITSYNDSKLLEKVEELNTNLKNLYNKVQSALFNDNYVSGEFGSKLDDILNSSERLNEKLVVINSNVSTKKGTEGNGNIDTGAQY